MKSAWVDRDAQDAVAHFGKVGIAPDLALRIYTTRLLGRDPSLVLHGGGNTSVKTRLRDLNGDETDVLCVKGSGWDMGTDRAARPARGAARRRCEERVRERRCPTRTWCGCSAPTSSILLRPTLRSKRCCTLSCRTNSSTIRTRPPCLASSTSPTVARSATKSMTGAWALCATSCRASALRRKPPMCSARTPRSRA